MPSNDFPQPEDECFFISRIGVEGTVERGQSDGVLAAIVEPAAKEIGLQAVRADRLPDPGQITTQIIEHLISARIVVADLSGRNPNVYYELAVRNAFRLPTALISQADEDLPFDTSVMRTILYDPSNLQSAAHARDELVTQMTRALDGAVDSPVATAVDLQSLREGSPLERQLVEISQSLEAVNLNTQELRRAINVRLNRVSLPDSLLRDLQEASERLEAHLPGDPVKTLDVEHVARLVRGVNDYVQKHAVRDGRFQDPLFREGLNDRAVQDLIDQLTEWARPTQEHRDDEK